MNKCFMCDKKIKGEPKHFADTRDDQHVMVGSDCFKKIKASGEEGFVHSSGGLRLWVIKDDSFRITGGGQFNPPKK